MSTNILVAIKNIVKNPVTDLVSYYSSSNRINNVGEALEMYVKDAFCDSVKEKNYNKKLKTFAKYFSYLGNQNNPPDIMIKAGDAIEVKKIQSKNSAIALNSSYPKDKLYANSTMITQECRDCESWTEKDLLYVVGVAKEDRLKSIWFVYGDCYAAKNAIYERIKNKISEGIHELSDVEFSETNELGRVNRVDPLGITFLRIRGMWQIENPIRVFSYLQSGMDSGFSVNALMLRSKYDSFPERDKMQLEKIKTKGFSISDVKIKSPNNPVKLLDAKLISFKK